MSEAIQSCNNKCTQIKEKIVKFNNFITTDRGLWNFYLTAEELSHFQWCKTWVCFVNIPWTPAITILLVWGDEIRELRHHTWLYQLCVSAQTTSTQPQTVLCFVYIPRQSLSEANKTALSFSQNLSKAPQNTAEPLRALSLSSHFHFHPVTMAGLHCLGGLWSRAEGTPQLHTNCHRTSGATALAFPL